MEIPENNAAALQGSDNKNEHLNALAKSLMLSKIAALVCVLIIVLGYFVAMNTSVEDIPLVSMTIEDADSFDDVKEDLKEIVEKMEDDKDSFEEFLEEASGKDMKKLDKLLKAMKKTAKCYSISNLKRTAKLTAEINEDVADALGLDDASSDLQESIKLLSTISTILLVFLIIGLFFTVLGSLRNVNGLVVVGAILTTLFCILFCGILLVILNLSTHVALICLQRQYKKAYKAFRAGTLNA